MPSTTPDVRDLLVQQIEADEQSIAPVLAQIEETQERIRRAKAALAALDGDVITTPRTSRQPARGASSRNGSTSGTAGPRLSPEERQAQVLSFLRENPGSTVKQMAEHLSVSSPAVYAILKGMDGKYTTTSEGRTKHYSAA
jgi:hypothetical protein